ncbi:YoaK family protein [Bdellovibrio sp. 22V]|uniref:YoaK family protein n=1 Tax=Bdellovibrio TaxID=958 RepID=UPI0025426F94|nr:YoaK family protein [Bdellovibrio sp. 22V]WII71586.1 YoaK family protein [Bdellovibrio sp. 22V]
MAFQAGAINTGGYLACHRFVSHVTGFGTMVGTEAAQGKWFHTLGALSVPGFFIGGTMLSAFFVDRRIQTGRRPLYPIVLFLILALTGMVAVAGNMGLFGKFGESFLARDYYLLAALCLASGIQNATITSAFGAIVRTTHLTGITTDLGIGVVRVISHSHKIQPRNNEIRANWMRIGLISFFTLGSFVSAYVYLHAQYWGFLIPCGIATILFFWSLVHFNKKLDNAS